jgi:hypothetical protein
MSDYDPAAFDRLDNCTDDEKHLALSWISGYSPDTFQKAMDRVESRRKPPRIPEPGLWGVVSAHVNGKHGPQATYKWAHAPWGWEAIGSTQATRKWEDLIDPVLVREGLGS